MTLILPDLVLQADYSNDWEQYLEALYAFFQADFVSAKPSYNGVPLRLKAHPTIDGKEATFWHLITKGPVEAQRQREFPRCERIRWPSPIIENGHTPPTVRVWENTRHTKKGIQNRICLCYGNWEYLVILDKRNGFLLPWTAYPIDWKPDKAKLEREYNAYHGITLISKNTP